MDKLPGSRRIARLKKITTLVYALQLASFLIGVTSVVALIINYVKRPDVQGSYLAHHFTWQIRTYWYGLLWGVLGLLAGYLFFLGYLILIADTVWIIYRILKGWLRLNENRPP